MFVGFVIFAKKHIASIFYNKLKRLQRIWEEFVSIWPRSWIYQTIWDMEILWYLYW